MLWVSLPALSLHQSQAQRQNQRQINFSEPQVGVKHGLRATPPKLRPLVLEDTSDRVSALWWLQTLPFMDILCIHCSSTGAFFSASCPGALGTSAIILSSVVFSAAVSSPLSDPSRPGSMDGRDLSYLGEGRCLNPFLQPGSWGRLTHSAFMARISRTFSLAIIGGLAGQREGCWVAVCAQALYLPIVNLLCWEFTYRVPPVLCWVYMSAPNNKIFLAGDTDVGKVLTF